MTLPIVSMWLIFRLLTSIVVALGSHIRPSTLLEQTIPILPPSQPMAVWLERAFLTPWLRWDASWYLQIVEHGYQATDGTAQFHPLFPWAATILAYIGIHPLLSLLVISSISGLGFLLIYYRLAKIDLPAHDSRFGIILMLLTPAAIVLFAPYAEALFLLCAASCLYLARIKRWWLAGLAGALAVLTRQQGLILLFPLAWELWEASARSWHSIKKNWRSWLAISLIPVGYLVWIAYRLYVLNDMTLNLNSLHNTIFSILISPSATEVVPQQHFTWPWLALGLAINKLDRIARSRSLGKYQLSRFLSCPAAAILERTQTSLSLVCCANHTDQLQLLNGNCSPLHGIAPPPIISISRIHLCCSQVEPTGVGTDDHQLVKHCILIHDRDLFAGSLGSLICHLHATFPASMLVMVIVYNDS